MDGGSNTVEEAMTKIIPKTKKFKKAKWLSDKALQISKKRRETKDKGEREEKSNRTQNSRE